MPRWLDDDSGTPEIPDDEPADADADARIRRAFDEIVPDDDHASAVLAQLRRPLQRARRRQQARTAIAGGVAAAVLLTVSLSVLPSDDRSTTLVADRPDVVPDTTEPATSATTGTLTVPPMAPDPSPGSSTSTTAPAATTQPAGTPTPTTSSPAVPPPTTTPPTTAPPATATPTTRQPNATTTTSSVSTTPANMRIESDCGAVIASAQNDRLRLQQTIPLTGYTATTETSGPSEITVKFTGPMGRCEIHLTASEGQVRSEIDVEPSGGAEQVSEDD